MTENSAASNMSLACERSVELGAYLLHGLSDTEAQDLRRHVDGCAHCTAELRSLRPVADLLAVADFAALPLSSEDVPDPLLLSRVLDRVALEHAPAEKVLAAPGVIVPIDRAGRRSRRRAALLAAGAFALGSVSTLGVQQVATDDTPPAQFPGADRVVFADMPTVDAIAWVRTNDAGTYAWLSTKGLAEGKTYKWWFERKDGSRVPMGSFVSTSKTPDGRLICPGSTAIPRKYLAFVGATDADGNDVLKAKLPYVHAT